MLNPLIKTIVVISVFMQIWKINFDDCDAFYNDFGVFDDFEDRF